MTFRVNYFNKDFYDTDFREFFIDVPHTGEDPGLLLTEAGDSIITESDDVIITED